MSKATNDMMDMLHQLTAEKLASIIRDGVEIVNKEGEVVNIPAPAAYISAAIKFLKDNDITADVNSERMNHMQSALKGIPQFEDSDDADHHTYN